MTIDVKDEQGVTVICVVGELDASGSTQLNETLDTLLSEGRRRLVIDLKEVDFIDSAGLSMLIRCFKHVQSASGDMRFAGLQPAVRRVFEITRLNRVFDLHSDTHDAVRHYTGGA